MHISFSFFIFSLAAVAVVASVATYAWLSWLKERSRVIAPDIGMSLEDSEYGYVRLDNRDFILGWNRAAERIFGYSANAAVGKSLSALIVPPEKLAEASELLNEARRGKVVACDTVRRHRDGRLLDVSISVAPLIGSTTLSGEVGQIIRDLSQRRRLEGELSAFNETLLQQVAERTAELEASRHYLRGILDAVPVTIAYWNKDICNEFANDTYAMRLGTTPAAMQGRSMLEIAGATVFENAQPYMAAALRGESQYVERSIKKSDGSGLRHALVYYLPDVRAGEVRGFYIIGHDVTEVTETRMHLLAQRQRLDYILRGTNAGTWEWHMPSGEIRINERWAAVLGYRLDELEPMTLESWLELVHPEDAASTQTLMQKHLSGELDYYEHECRMHHCDGSWIWVENRGSISTRFPDGRPEWVCGTQMEITARHESEGALRRATVIAEAANAAKSNFLANMSHEIRTPLNAVLGMAYLLDTSELDEEQRGYVHKLALAGTSLLDVINDVLDLSKIEAGEMLLETTVFDPRAMLRELDNLMRAEAQAKHLVLHINVAANVPVSLLADVIRVRQILLNLIGNAIKFTERGEVIVTVTAEPLDTQRVLLVYSIRDTGIGIKFEEQARLFAPFTQADVSTTRRFGGTGLGLSIVQRLTDLMGGEVGVHSEPAHGSEFWVKLPLAMQSGKDVNAHDAGVPQLFSAESRRERLTGLRVLIVDDNPVNQEVMCSVLKRSGAVTFTRGDGLEAVEFLRTEEVDIVLMDVHMPVMDGCEATRQIRNQLGLTALPILAVTAGAMVTERQIALEAGMNEFLTKPLPPARLVQILQGYAERGRSNTRN